MHKKITLFVAAAVALTMAGGAFAGGLTADEAKRFTASLKGTESFRDSLEESGHTALMNKAFEPKDGEPFQPFTSAVKMLKAEAPAKYTEFEGLIAPHGFRDTGNWGSVGDKVILAYIAIELTGNAQMMQMVEQITPEMIESMPPEYRGRLVAAKAMFEQIQETPEADRAVVRAIKSDLEAVLDLPAGMGGMPGQ